MTSGADDAGASSEDDRRDDARISSEDDRRDDARISSEDDRRDDAGASSEDDRRDGSEDADRRIVVANGQDLNKRYYYEILKRMGRDWDLRKLSLFGPPLWIVLSLIGLVLALSSLVGRLQSTARTSVSLLQWFQGLPTWMAIVAVLGVLVGVILAALYSGVFLKQVVDLAAIRKWFENLRAIKRLEVWQNLNYWHPFTSHLSDRDPVVPFTTDSEANVSSIYADGPHYQNVFVDAVYLRPDGALSPTRRAIYWLYRWDDRRRWLRRGAYGVALIAAAITALQLTGRLNAQPVGAWTLAVLTVVTAASLIVVVLTIVAIDYPYLHLQFYSDSAGLSRYSQLLNEKSEGVSRGEEVGLGNSMNGYGVFYVSKVLAALFDGRRLDLSIDPAHLAPGATESDDDTDGTSFPASGVAAYPGAEHAAAAGAEVLWSSVPARSLRNPPDDPDMTLELAGVDYYTVAESGSGREQLVKATAGDRTGLRLPVKKFVSVTDGLEAGSLDVPNRQYDMLYRGDWDESEVHTLYVGGGEHQQAITKLALALKAEGYRNVDIRENAFAVGAESSRPLSGRFYRELTALWGDTGPERHGNGDQGSDQIHFPTEYFVSLVSGDDQFFRQDESRHGHGFLLFRHDTSDDDSGTSAYAHVLIGLSAVGTKTGALFWHHLVENDFQFTVSDRPWTGNEDGGDHGSTPGQTDRGEERTETLEEDVMYFFDAPGPIDHPLCRNDRWPYDDVGDLYTRTEWRSDGLTFHVHGNGRTATSRSHGTAAETEIGTRFYDLRITGLDDRS